MFSFLRFCSGEHKAENSQSSPEEYTGDLVENFETNWYPDPVLAKICYVKIVVDNIDRCPNKTTHFVVQSVLGEDQISAGHVVVKLKKSTACAEYKCPESDDHEIRVNVKPLTAGYFIKDHEATQDFINEMNSTVSEFFSFKPEFDLRKPSIGIIQSESAVFLDEGDGKEKIAEKCMEARNAGIRFTCSR